MHSGYIILSVLLNTYYYAIRHVLPDLNRILIYPFKMSCGLTPARFNSLRAYRRFAGVTPSSLYV